MPVLMLLQCEAGRCDGAAAGKRRKAQAWSGHFGDAVCVSFLFWCAVGFGLLSTSGFAACLILIRLDEQRQSARKNKKQKKEMKKK